MAGANITQTILYILILLLAIAQTALHIASQHWDTGASALRHYWPHAGLKAVLIWVRLTDNRRLCRTQEGVPHLGVADWVGGCGDLVGAVLHHPVSRRRHRGCASFSSLPFDLPAVAVVQEGLYCLISRADISCASSPATTHLPPLTFIPSAQPLLPPFHPPTHPQPAPFRWPTRPSTTPAISRCPCPRGSMLTPSLIVKHVRSSSKFVSTRADVITLTIFLALEILAVVLDGMSVFNTADIV